MTDHRSEKTNHRAGHRPAAAALLSERKRVEQGQAPVRWRGPQILGRTTRRSRIS